MPDILSHRGLWTSPPDRNTVKAFRASFDSGFGVETDIRDANGQLVISHNVPQGDEPTFEHVLALQAESMGGPLAINIKADGLAARVAEALSSAGDPEAFCFDMSVPDMLGYREAGLRFFTRHSEYETHPALYADAAGVWLDCFESEWFDAEVLSRHRAAGKQVCIVSPELHGRDHVAAWAQWRQWDTIASPDVLICTDLPLQARQVFQAS